MQTQNQLPSKSKERLELNSSYVDGITKFSNAVRSINHEVAAKDVGDLRSIKTETVNAPPTSPNPSTMRSVQVSNATVDHSPRKLKRMIIINGSNRNNTEMIEKTGYCGKESSNPRNVAGKEDVELAKDPGHYSQTPRDLGICWGRFTNGAPSKDRRGKHDTWRQKRRMERPDTYM